jgi:putative chitinase
LSFEGFDILELNLSQLHSIMPLLSSERAAEYLPFLNASLNEFEINTPLRIAAYVAQLAHESGQLKYMEEIASGQAYEGRKDLGNTQPGDGRRFKGRGPLQLTGRSNYEAYGKLLGLDLISHPEQAATPQVGFRIAGLFWEKHGLNGLADRQVFIAITKIINGGTNGLEDRLKYYARAKRVLGIKDHLEN